MRWAAQRSMLFPTSCKFNQSAPGTYAQIPTHPSPSRMYRISRQVLYEHTKTHFKYRGSFVVPKVSLHLHLLTGDHFSATHAAGASIWAPVLLLRNLWSMHFPTPCKFNQSALGTYAQICVFPRPAILMNPHRVLTHSSPRGMAPLKCIGNSSLLHGVTSETSSTSALTVHTLTPRFL